MARNLSSALRPRRFRSIMGSGTLASSECNLPTQQARGKQKLAPAQWGRPELPGNVHGLHSPTTRGEALKCTKGCLTVTTCRSRLCRLRHS